MLRGGGGLDSFFQGAFSSFRLNVKKPTSWAKKGGGSRPQDPPDPLLYNQRYMSTCMYVYLWYNVTPLLLGTVPPEFEPRMGVRHQGHNMTWQEEWSYVTVRPKAHMFTWLQYTTHPDGYKNRPLVFWHQVACTPCRPPPPPVS